MCGGVIFLVVRKCKSGDSDSGPGGFDDNMHFTMNSTESDSGVFNIPPPINAPGGGGVEAGDQQYAAVPMNNLSQGGSFRASGVSWLLAVICLEWFFNLKSWFRIMHVDFIFF